jgi:hypothetical protein
MLRLRWWLPLGFAVLAVGYIGLNMATLVMVMAGAPGHADPVLHAPLYWLFGR